MTLFEQIRRGGEFESHIHFLCCSFEFDQCDCVCDLFVMASWSLRAPQLISCVTLCVNVIACLESFRWLFIVVTIVAVVLISALTVF